MKKVLFTCLFLTSGIVCSSQVFRGTIRDAQSNKPLPYSNIGIKEKSIGGISDSNGEFAINLSKAVPSDTIIISYVGYESVRRVVSSLRLDREHPVGLRPSVRMLQDVVVNSKYEAVILGNKSKSSRHTGWGDYSSGLGRAIGLFVPAYDIPVRVNRVFFHLQECEFDSIRLRINFFTPEEGLIATLQSQTKNIFLTVTRRRGWIEVPLQEDIIVRSQDLIVALEWVDAWAKPRTLEDGGSYVFTLSLANQPGYHYLREAPEEPIQLVKADRTPSIYLECIPVRE